ncbi:FAD/NAD(P)-binding protein [Neorhizobium sp. T786]|uniref:FAD/NAD(P)-binding protein n=1 Tax=Pseudorhizobium xiangyangii TaxID=2883104 RepID=UPI001CFF799C|nr:FAD/NAD(P)-binding protein [Neorhizobium xiangyangii]MCB5205445.1 FAD/NAD(P)-binding protein [Neorhizobium xiangyangii]
MIKRVAIVGSGPTAIYALQNLIASPTPLAITVFEAESVAGKGTPYQRDINDPAMLSNIPSVEIPELPQSLVEWLATLPDFESSLRPLSNGVPRRGI